jgi:hypothetical protein
MKRERMMSSALLGTRSSVHEKEIQQIEDQELELMDQARS